MTYPTSPLSGVAGIGHHDAFTKPKKKFEAKGHDRQLEDAQYGKWPVCVETIDGDNYFGVISRRDKWTITVQLETPASAGDPIVYKHAIKAVFIKRPEAK